MIIEPQVTLPNPKGTILDKIQNSYYRGYKCPYHLHTNCLMIMINPSTRRFHCLYDIPAKEIRYKYYDSSKSCDIPENFHDMILLHNKLGSKYVLPFVTHFRVASGETIGLFECSNPDYGGDIIKPDYLVETFLTYLVLLCESCYRLGGTAPALNKMKFIYTKYHPILVDIHIKNSVRRNRSQLEEIFSQKKWKKFLTTRTSKEIIHCMKLIHTFYFKKKTKHNQTCILIENIEFDNITHDIFCKQKKTSLYDILNIYKHHVPSLSNHIQQILDSINVNKKLQIIE